ncbi:hypothetical protein GQ42DRAFT_157369 [Ramicandelaber brevisporus]|nr:hypothetical protein GQ42DRAFT_157369 [Ramicandelaber brevisporus]
MENTDIKTAVELVYDVDVYNGDVDEWYDCVVDDWYDEDAVDEDGESWDGNTSDCYDIDEDEYYDQDDLDWIDHNVMNNGQIEEVEDDNDDDSVNCDSEEDVDGEVTEMLAEMTVSNQAIDASN